MHDEPVSPTPPGQNWIHLVPNLNCWIQRTPESLTIAGTATRVSEFQKQEMSNRISSVKFLIFLSEWRLESSQFRRSKSLLISGLLISLFCVSCLKTCNAQIFRTKVWFILKTVHIIHMLWIPMLTKNRNLSSTSLLYYIFIHTNAIYYYLVIKAFTF